MQHCPTMKVETTEVRSHRDHCSAISNIAVINGTAGKAPESHKMRLIRYLWPNAHGPAFQTSTSVCSPDSYGRSALSVTLVASLRETPDWHGKRKLFDLRARRSDSAAREARLRRTGRAGTESADSHGLPQPGPEPGRRPTAPAGRPQPFPHQRRVSRHRKLP
jgi:hypothetical protein